MKAKILEAKIHNLRFWVNETDPKTLKKQFENYLNQVDFTILNCSDQHFPEQGYTVFWLLAESHLAIHTFPDKYCSYVELSSCNQAKTEAFQQLVEAGEMKPVGYGKGIEICEPD